MVFVFNVTMDFLLELVNVRSSTFCVEPQISRQAYVFHAIKDTLFQVESV
jgi:hypothetical protein